MLLRYTRRLITTKLFLNFFSCLAGFFIWHFLQESHCVEQIISVPLCFDHVTQNRTIRAPETLDVTIRATRSMIRQSKQHGTAVIDVASLADGTHHMVPELHTILLPTAVKVVNYNPITVTLSAATL